MLFGSFMLACLAYFLWHAHRAPLIEDAEEIAAENTVALSNAGVDAGDRSARPLSDHHASAQ